MQVSVESTGNIDRKMTVEVPSERVTQAVEQRLKGLTKRVRIDGFRPGKVPLSVVRQRYSESVYQEVVGEVLEQSFQEAIAEQKLRVAGLPQVDLQDADKEKSLTYTANFQVYPEFEVADVTSLEITRPVSAVNDEDIDKMVEVIREQQKEWSDVERAAQEGDMVRINFEGTLEGEAFEGGSAEDFAVELGAGRMLPDFEAALQGMSAGEEKTADVAFPEEYQAENLKGKTAQFKLTLNSVQESVLPEINEEFIERFGIADKTVESFRAEVRKNMERELTNAIKMQVKQQVMDGIATLHDIEVPNALVTDEIKHVRNEFTQNTGTPADNVPEELFKPQAERRVKLGLIVGEVIRQNDMKRDEERVEALLNSLAASYEDPAELIKYYRENPQAMQTIEAAAMEEMIVDWVLEKATVTDEERPFNDVIQQQQAPAEQTEEAEA